MHWEQVVFHRMPPIYLPAEPLNTIWLMCQRLLEGFPHWLTFHVVSRRRKLLILYRNLAWDYLFSRHFAFIITVCQMKFGLKRMKTANRWPWKRQCPVWAFPPPTRALHHGLFKRKQSETNYDMLAKDVIDVIDFFWEFKDRSLQNSKLLKRNQNFFFEAEKKKKKKKRTFRPQLVSADGPLLWRAITQMLSIIDMGKSFGLTLLFGYGFNCPEYEVWGPLTYHINGSE